MKFEKNFFLIVIFVTFISGCSSIKDTLTGVKKQNTDEFLVKKKDPLVLPPNFNDLPKPQTQKNSENNGEESIDFSNILSESENKKEIIKNEGSLERSISNILNNK
jgi:PBP1b-binding outer membrane lipoprotein LpoB